MIQANGGVIRDGMFVLDPHVMGTIAANVGATPSNPIPKYVPAEPRWCNPTPPFAPTLGGYTDPVTGHYCHPIAAQRWPFDWQRINPNTTVVSGPVSGFGATPSWVAPVVVVGIVVGIGYLIYKSMQQRAAVYRSVAEKEGSSGLLKLEAGEAAMELVGMGAAELMERGRPRRNRKRAKRRRK